MLMFDVVLAVALSTAAPDVPPAAVANVSQTVRVAAIAADVHAVVLRSPDGQTQRYAEGARVNADWRVKRVEGDAVVLVAQQRIGREAVELGLRRDESVDLGAASSTLNTLSAPVHRPQRTQWIPQKRPPAANP
jgi:hypothetical protein